MFSFGGQGLRETGRFIDKGWQQLLGVEQVASKGERLIALSDRDYGLYHFKYTGPGSDNRRAVYDRDEYAAETGGPMRLVG